MARSRIRTTLRQMLSKPARRRLIEGYIKHRYWYNQGSSSLGILDDMFPVEKAIIFVAGLSYIFSGEWVERLPIIIVGGILLAIRILGKWATGAFWHNSDGYDIETEWNRGKVPPGRAEVVNVEDLAIQIAKYVRLDGQSFKKVLEAKNNREEEE